MSAETTNSARVFVALEVPPAVRDRLTAAVRRLRDELPAARPSWTRPENIHLTLRFLGNVRLDQIPVLIERVHAALAGFGPLDLVAQGLGCFPDARHPRVLWAGVHSATEPALGEALAQLHGRVVRATAEFTQEPVETRFVGHLTLARFKQINRSEAAAIAEFVEHAEHERFGEWTAHRVVVMRSELLPGGSRYEALAELPL